MKQYEKIWVPVKVPKIFDDDLDECTAILKGPVIVLTQEELREVFTAGYWNAKDATNPANLGFKSYLQSKGIELP